MEQNLDYKKSKAPSTTITRDLNKLEGRTGNIYEAVMICTKRANQIAVEIKEELSRKLEEFANYTDNLEECRVRNRLRSPFTNYSKTHLDSLEEFENDQIYVRKAE
jgi:hypothetical protein